MLLLKHQAMMVHTSPPRKPSLSICCALHPPSFGLPRISEPKNVSLISNGLCALGLTIVAPNMGTEVSSTWRVQNIMALVMFLFRWIPKNLILLHFQSKLVRKMIVDRSLHKTLMKSASNENESSSSSSTSSSDKTFLERNLNESEMTKAQNAMVTMLNGYKKYISPLLPPACRFVPTCSEYAIQSVQEFGPTKGLVLTAWRLLRCNPLGGSGLDQPRWPPPGWFAGT